MLCEKPFFLGVMPCRCMKCDPCLMYRKKLWASRIMLEAATHGENCCFVTLTYDDDHAPEGGSLVKKDLQDWLKRIRKAVAPIKIRYYGAGEYGDTSWRPHYHVALFGLDLGSAGGPDGRGGVVADTWRLGFSFVGDLSDQSAAYVAGYVTKKMTKKDDWRLHGRQPEFQTMSLRPGIAAVAVGAISEAVGSEYATEDVLRNHDVPHALKRARKGVPLGRYVRGLLREKVGFGTRKAHPLAVEKYSLEMRNLFEDALRDPANASKSLGKIFVDMNAQKIKNSLARAKIFASAKKI